MCPSTGNTQGSFTITLSTAKDSFRIGSPVIVTATVTNKTNHPVDFSGSYVNLIDYGFGYDVRDEDGNEARLVAGRLSGMEGGSPYWSTIAPHESVKVQVPLELLYKLDQPGRYTVQMCRRDTRIKDASGNPIDVASNTITFNMWE